LHGEKKHFSHATKVGKSPSGKIRYGGQKDFWIRAAPERAHTGSQKNGKKLFPDRFGFWKFWHEDILAWSLTDKSSRFSETCVADEMAVSCVVGHYDETTLSLILFSPGIRSGWFRSVHLCIHLRMDSSFASAGFCRQNENSEKLGINFISGGGVLFYSIVILDWKLILSF
jgi:hypothetical protein